MRWLQFATWSPTLRDHYGDHPNDPVDMWKDASTIAAYRDAARVHSQLWPYLYTQAVEAGRTGLPIIRYLPLEVPQDPRAWQEERSYFLGPDLLVAPVLEPGARTRTVYLPVGRWADFWTDTVYEGGQDVTVPAPLDGGYAPVFVRAGALLPLATDYDSLVQGATDTGPLRTYDGDLIIRIAGDARQPASTSLYDGTRFDWDGVDTMRITGGTRARGLTVKVPGHADVSAHVTAAGGTLRIN
jgi:alpha-glucosidase (family GH31 glycosyl hydrolase)